MQTLLERSKPDPEKMARSKKKNTHFSFFAAAHFPAFFFPPAFGGFTSHGTQFSTSSPKIWQALADTDELEIVPESRISSRVAPWGPARFEIQMTGDRQPTLHSGCVCDGFSAVNSRSRRV